MPGQRDPDLFQAGLLRPLVGGGKEFLDLPRSEFPTKVIQSGLQVDGESERMSWWMMSAGEIECREQILGVRQKITPRGGTECPEGVASLASHRAKKGKVPPARILDHLLTRLLDRKSPQRSRHDETILWFLSRLRLPTHQSRVDEGVEVTCEADSTTQSLLSAPDDETTTDAAASHVNGPENTESWRRVNLAFVRKGVPAHLDCRTEAPMVPGLSDVHPLSAVGPTSRRSSSISGNRQGRTRQCCELQGERVPVEFGAQSGNCGNVVARVNRNAGSAASRQSQNIWTAGARRARRGSRTPLGGRRSGPTLRTCSPSRPKRLRLVASTNKLGSPSRAREMARVASSEKSIPSTSTIRRRRVDGDAGSGNSILRGSSIRKSKTPSSLGPACPDSLTISVTIPASRVRRRIASSATALLPMPLGPTRVTVRTSSRFSSAQEFGELCVSSDQPLPRRRHDGTPPQTLCRRLQRLLLATDRFTSVSPSSQFDESAPSVRENERPYV